MPVKRSPCWDYFVIKPTDHTKVICQVNNVEGNICGEEISRGPGGPKTFTTSTMARHIERFHKKEAKLMHHKADVQKKEEEKATLKRRIELEQYSLVKKPKEENVDANGKTIPAIFPVAYSKDNPKQRRLDYDLANVLIETGSSINFVTYPSVKALVRNLSGDPKLTVPSRARITDKVIPDMVGRIKQFIVDQLKNNCSVGSATTDMWSSDSKDDYMAFTFHYIDSDWKRKMVMLSTFPFNKAHTGENIGMEMLNVIDDWGLDDKVHLVLRDNASNMLSAMRSCQLEGVGCFLHILHLVVTHSIKKTPVLAALIRKVEKNCIAVKSSGPVREEYKKAQTAWNIEPNKLILAGETRWTGIFEMLKRFLEQKQAIIQVCTTRVGGNALDPLNSGEWELLEQALSILSKFNKFTVKMQAETTCISEVIPTIKVLRKHLDTCEKTLQVEEFSTFVDDNAGTLVAKLQLYLDGYFLGTAPKGVKIRKDFKSVEDNVKFTYATLLDPKFKDSSFSSDGCMLIALQGLIGEVADMIKKERGDVDEDAVPVDTPASLPEPRPCSPTNDWDEVLDDLDKDATAHQPQPDNGTRTALDIAEEEVMAYRREIKPLRNPDMLEFWAKQQDQGKYLHLCKLARAYLSPPAGTVPAERSFKVSADMSSGDRSRMSPKNVQMLTFLKYNLRAVGYDVLGLPPWDKANGLLILGVPEQLQVVAEDITADNFVSLDDAIVDLGADDIFE